MSIGNRLLPFEIKHTLPNWGLVDYRKEELEKEVVCFASVSFIAGKNKNDYQKKVSIIFNSFKRLLIRQGRYYGR